jgi:hypothetical protein
VDIASGRRDPWKIRRQNKYQGREQPGQRYAENFPVLFHDEANSPPVSFYTDNITSGGGIWEDTAGKQTPLFIDGGDTVWETRSK